MSRDQLKAMLKQHEGTGPTKNGRLMPYQDTVGKTTVGWGRNLTDRGLSVREAEYLLEHDIDDAIKDLLTKFPWVESLSPARQAVLVDMTFNLGVPRLALFVKMLAAVKRGDYATAAVEMLTSRWAEQVGARSRRLAKQMETGEWA